MKNPFKMLLPKNRILQMAKNIAIKVDSKKEYYRQLSDEELKNKTDEFIKILNRPNIVSNFKDFISCF